VRPLSWADFRLECTEGGWLQFRWTDFGSLEVAAEHCSSAALQASDSGDGHQMVFVFQQAEGAAPLFLVTRVPVPEQYRPAAEQFLEALRNEHGIPERAAEHDGEDAALERVPLDSQEWLVAPARRDSEALFEHVMAQITADQD
jgi:hypothetical protein